MYLAIINLCYCTKSNGHSQISYVSTYVTGCWKAILKQTRKLNSSYWWIILLHSCIFFLHRQNGDIIMFWAAFINGLFVALWDAHKLVQGLRGCSGGVIWPSMSKTTHKHLLHCVLDLSCCLRPIGLPVWFMVVLMGTWTHRPSPPPHSTFCHAPLHMCNP